MSINNRTGIWLQVDVYEADDTCIIKEFEVPEWWLENQIREEYGTVKNFLSEYTSDESSIIYCKAVLENMILLEIEG